MSEKLNTKLQKPGKLRLNFYTSQKSTETGPEKTSIVWEVKGVLSHGNILRIRRVDNSG